MDDEFDLPGIPREDPVLPAAPPFQSTTSRKRSHLTDYDALSTLINTSSDPALFSSDETPDAENYAGDKKRRKKKWTGTWWGERTRSGLGWKNSSNHESPVTSKKRQFRRNFDSGVFMASDDSGSSGIELSSDSSFGQELMEEQMRQQDEKRKAQDANITKMRRMFDRRDSQDSASKVAVKKLSLPVLISPKHHQVRRIIQKCLDEGKEDVDLSSMNIETLPPDITSLNSMVMTRLMDEKEAFLSMSLPIEAHLRLYLSNNLIRQFPSPLLDLHNLQILSLRRNKLTELPPGIRNLTNLRELNVSSNKLQYLPFEVIELTAMYKLKTIHTEPNPWLPCADGAASPYVHTELKLESSSQNALGHRRLLAVGENIPLQPNGSEKEKRGSRESARTRTDPSRPARLTEMVLRQLATINPVGTDLSTMMPMEDTSENVLNMLTALHTAQVGGGKKCSNLRCKRDMVIPTWKRMEWWDVKNSNSIRYQEAEDGSVTMPDNYEPQRVPFLREFCGQCRYPPSDAGVEENEINLLSRGICCNDPDPERQNQGADEANALRQMTRLAQRERPTAIFGYQL